MDATLDTTVTQSTGFLCLEINPQKVEEIENSSEDDADLARELFRLVFKKELHENPGSVYCSKVDWKEQLNQEYLKGIRCKYACTAQSVSYL